MSFISKNKEDQPRKPKTLGTRRAPITKYYRSESQTADTVSPFARKKTARKARKYIFGALDIILVLILIFGIGYSLMVKPQPKIVTNDSTFHSKNEYFAFSSQQLSQLKNRNKITLDETGIKNELRKKFPEITSVQIELPFFSEQPTIRLSIAKPSFILDSHGSSYVINASGVAAAKASDMAHSKDLPIITDQSGFIIKPGSQVLTSESTLFISNLIAQLKHANVPILSLTLPTAAEELDLKTKDQTYFVKFYPGGDVASESGQFLASRKHFSESGQQPSEYLDVRVNGKIFYK